MAYTKAGIMSRITVLPTICRTPNGLFTVPCLQPQCGYRSCMGLLIHVISFPSTDSEPLPLATAASRETDAAPIRRCGTAKTVGRLSIRRRAGLTRLLRTAVSERQTSAPSGPDGDRSAVPRGAVRGRQPARRGGVGPRRESWQSYAMPAPRLW